jgi:hypothetical protein
MLKRNDRVWLMGPITNCTGKNPLRAGSLCRTLDQINDRKFPFVHHVWKKMLRHQRSLSSNAASFVISSSNHRNFCIRVCPFYQQKEPSGDAPTQQDDKTPKVVASRTTGISAVIWYFPQQTRLV